jgi:glycosyltransferase involved in cell wall biosynthesis
MPYLPLIRKHSKALISFKSHNIEHEIWERIATNTPSLLNRMYLKILAKRIRCMEYRALQQADVNITVTQRDADSIAKISNLPVHVAPAGISLKHTIIKENNPKFPSLFFLGALDWAPNQEGILWFTENVWSKLVDTGIDCPLEIAGRNCPEWLKEKLCATPQLVFHGEVENAYTFMNERALMLVPLFSGSGMRVKIIEGMALGKAIISTTIGAEGIPTTPNENILIADTATEFANTIQELMQDRSRLTSIGNNARSFALQNYDISNIVTQLTGFWKKHLRK